MDITNDSLARTAHAFGITDVEFEARQKELKELARLELVERSIRALREAAARNEPAEMPEVHRNHEEPSYDPYY
jgi:Pyruvate/2-oxoacid:ferredoxin oxidoreductase gamma subunit